MFGAVLDAEWKPECSEKNLRKQVSTEKQIHIDAGTGNRTQDSLLQNEGSYAALVFLSAVLHYKTI